MTVHDAKQTTEIGRKQQFLKVKSAPVNFTNEQENDLETSSTKRRKNILSEFF